MRSIFMAFIAASTLMAGGPHVIPAEKAKAMVEAHKAKAKKATAAEPADLQSVTLPAEAIQKFLKQKGLVKVRIYRALNEGKETFVLLGVDASGSDMVAPGQQGVDNGEPCPPLCNR